MDRDFGRGLYIDGQWQQSRSGRSFPVTNPADGSVIAEIPDAGAEETRAAIDAAHRAFPAWAARPALERARILMDWSRAMEAHQDELARLMTDENGKPLAESRGEVSYAAGFAQWFGEEARRVYGEIVPAATSLKRIWVLRQPVGVVGAITPWNFPAAMVTRKVAPALAAGCTVILKPAEQTPLTAIAIVRLLEEAGIPPGVVNVVVGQDPVAIGDALLDDPRVRKITFTGSTEVGKHLMRRSADTMKRVSLELGGQAPFLVFADADLDLAVQGAIASKFRNTGQTCVSANRIYVEEPVVDEFAHRMAQRVKEMRVGRGTEPGVVVGPLIDRQGYEKVKLHLEDAVRQGASVATGGRVYESGGGFYAEPTVLVGVEERMVVMREETFGPVAPISSFKTEAEALERANATPYGLAAYAYTRDLARGVRVAEGLEYGIVGLNDGMPSTPQAPFGGFKESGQGREGGRQGMDAFLEIKFVSVGLG